MYVSNIYFKLTKDFTIKEIKEKMKSYSLVTKLSEGGNKLTPP